MVWNRSFPVHALFTFSVEKYLPLSEFSITADGCQRGIIDIQSV